MSNDAALDMSDPTKYRTVMMEWVETVDCRRMVNVPIDWTEDNDGELGDIVADISFDAFYSVERNSFVWKDTAFRPDAPELDLTV